MKLMHLLAAAAVAGGLVLSAPAAALAQSSACTVENTSTGRTSSAPDGTHAGSFRCAGGHWELPAGADVITADVVAVDAAGTVTAPAYSLSTKGDNPTMAQLAGLAQALNGSKQSAIASVVVAADDGKVRTPTEVKALFAGKDTTGLRVLAKYDQPAAGATVGDLVDQAGSSGPTVVYFSVWGAVKAAVGWVVDGLKSIGNAIEGAADDIADWVTAHCHYEVVNNRFTIICH